MLRSSVTKCLTPKVEGVLLPPQACRGQGDTTAGQGGLGSGSACSAAGWRGAGGAEAEADQPAFLGYGGVAPPNYRRFLSEGGVGGWQLGLVIPPYLLCAARSWPVLLI